MAFRTVVFGKHAIASCAENECLYAAVHCNPIALSEMLEPADKKFDLRKRKNNQLIISSNQGTAVAYRKREAVNQN